MPDELNSENEPERVVDNRMSFIRLLESTEEREYSLDYEIASEVRITGQLTYSNDITLRFLTPEPNRDGLFKYTLSISAPAAYQLPRYQASGDGYYFQGGWTEEILSLASLYLRCRFFPVSYIFRDLDGLPITKIEHDFNYVLPQKNTDSFLFNDSPRNFVSLGDFFDQIKRLPSELHHGFANAIRLYALALREIGVNDELAYVHLVSAVEVLSKYQVILREQDPLEEFADQITNLLESAGQAAKSELGNLFKQRKAMVKFIEFIKKYCEGVIDDRPDQGALEDKIYLDNLPDALKKIYNGRSKFLHEGSAMYISMPRATVAGCDYDASRGQTIGNREFGLEDKLPNILFFENLVRQCLLNYLTKNIAM